MRSPLKESRGEVFRGGEDRGREGEGNHNEYVTI